MFSWHSLSVWSLREVFLDTKGQLLRDRLGQLGGGIPKDAISDIQSPRLLRPQRYDF